jgi:hypothetical protein
MDASQIGKRAWSYAGVLQDAGLSCFEYVEQLTLLLFLKMADQLTEEPYNRAPIVPPELGWKALLPPDGAFLEDKYREILEKLGLERGMLGADLDRDEKRALQEDLVEGMELSPKVGRMCAMNLYLHGIGGDVIFKSARCAAQQWWSRTMCSLRVEPARRCAETLAEMQGPHPAALANRHLVFARR